MFIGEEILYFRDAFIAFSFSFVPDCKVISPLISDYEYKYVVW